MQSATTARDTVTVCFDRPTGILLSSKRPGLVHTQRHGKMYMHTFFGFEQRTQMHARNSTHAHHARASTSDYLAVKRAMIANPYPRAEPAHENMSTVRRPHESERRGSVRAPMTCPTPYAVSKLPTSAPCAFAGKPCSQALGADVIRRSLSTHALAQRATHLLRSRCWGHTRTANLTTPAPLRTLHADTGCILAKMLGAFWPKCRSAAKQL